MAGRIDQPDTLRAAVLDAVNKLMQGCAPTQTMTTKDLRELMAFVARASVAIVLAQVAAEMRGQQLDETHASTPGGRTLNMVDHARDLGYRAGCNDTLRAWSKLFDAATYAPGSAGAKNETA